MQEPMNDSMCRDPASMCPSLQFHILYFGRIFVTAWDALSGLRLLGPRMTPRSDVVLVEIGLLAFTHTIQKTMKNK